jgi:hypothetical protein
MSYHRSNLVFNLLFWVYEFFYRIIVHLFPIERRSLLLNGRSGFCLIKRVLILAFFLYTIYILIERLSFFFPLQIIDLELESRTCKYYIVKPASGILLNLIISLSFFFIVHQIQYLWESSNQGWISWGLWLSEQKGLLTRMVFSFSMFPFPVAIPMYPRYVVEDTLSNWNYFLVNSFYFNSNKMSLFLWQNVHYHSGGLRLNPNLYAGGKVCLSLLNTWHGNKKEKWTPGVSTMLQVLVSIQGLILNAKPYFNEPGCAYKSGTQSGEAQSLKYNENTFILSMRRMMYTIKRPPKVCFYSWFISFISLI